MPAANLASRLQHLSTSPPSVSHICRMSEPVPDPKPPSTSEPAEDPWHAAFVEFKKRDEKMVADYQEEINALLIVAGLFSAVLTAFVVESYQSLKHDYTETTAELLWHISRQLANSSLPAAHKPVQFQVQQSDVQVNVYWFVSLLLRLIVALFAILLKQWMRAYMNWTDVKPDREAVELRQFRYRNLESWHLGLCILTVLPTLLQLAVSLYMRGLLVLLWNLNQTLAAVMAVLLAITFDLFATVTVLPAVSRSCPYRYPVSELIALKLLPVANCAKFVIVAVRAFIRSRFRDVPNYKEELTHQWRLSRFNFKSWAEADGVAIAQRNSRKDLVSLTVGTMVHLCRTTRSQSLWSAAIAGIIEEYPVDNLIPFDQHVYYDQVWWPLLDHIGQCSEANCRDWYRSELDRNTSSAFRRLSSSMKDSWVGFLLHPKTLVCGADSTIVAQSYMICCLASLESTTGGPCMQAFMEVLKAQWVNLEKYQLDSVVYCLAESPKTALLHSLSDIKFIQSVKFICDQLSVMHTVTQAHRDLLDILVQLACHFTMATTKEPLERVPEDLEDVLRSLLQVDNNIPSRQSNNIVSSFAPALIGVARREPDLFPKSFARAIVHELDPLPLWNIACGVDGLNIQRMNVELITNNPRGQDYLWTRLDGRAPNATDRFIEPQVFSRILDAYEEQVEQKRRHDPEDI